MNTTSPVAWPAFMDDPMLRFESSSSDRVSRSIVHVNRTAATETGVLGLSALGAAG
jgi:hypothetical protein